MVKIQEYLTCAIQNIQVLVKYGYRPKKGLAMVMEQVKERGTMVIRPVLNSIKPYTERIQQCTNEIVLNRLMSFNRMNLCY